MGYAQLIFKAVSFIESRVTEPISVHDIAVHVAYSRFHFHRLFQAVTGQPPGTYLRQRRLVHAAQDLISSDRRILDIALDYQFGSHEAFTRAFQKQFHLPPVKYRRRGQLVSPDISPITIKMRLLHYRGGKHMVPKIVTLDRILLVGMAYFGENTEGEIPALWDSFCQRMTEIKHVVGRSAYGVCLETDDYEKTGKFQYIAALPVRELTDIPEGMTGKEVPAGKYAVFTHKGPIATLHNTYEKIYGTWVKEAQLDVVKGYDFELYDHRFTSPEDPNSELDIYIPLSH